MPSTTTLQLRKRERAGTTETKALRREGRVPATLYGHRKEATNVSVDLRALTELVRSGADHHLIDIQVENGGRETALVRDVQRDIFNGTITHADLMRVSSDESVRAAIPLVLTGTSPGVKNAGGILDFVLHQVEVSGPASALPEQIEVDISRLGLREHLSATELPLPPGFTLLTPGESVIVSIETPRVSTITEEVPAPTGPTAAAVPT